MKRIKITQSIRFATILIVASVFLSVFGYTQMEMHSLSRAEQALTSSAQEKLAKLQSEVVLLDNLAKIISTDTSNLITNVRFAKTLGAMQSVAYVSADGNMVNSEGGSGSVSESEYFKAATQGQQFIGKVTDNGPYHGKVVITSAIGASTGNIGFILGAYDQASFNSSSQNEDNISLLLTSSDGTIIPGDIFLSSNLLPYNTVDELFAASDITKEASAAVMGNIKASTAGKEIISIGKAKQFMVNLPVGGEGVSVLAFMDFSVIDKETASSASIIFIVIALLFIVALALEFLILSKNRTVFLEIENKNDRLEMLEKEYKIVADHSNQMMFRFYPESGSVQLSEELSALQGLPRIIKNSPELSIESGLIDRDSAQEYLQFFKSIRSHAPGSKCEIKCNLSTGTAWYDMDYTMLKNAEGEAYAIISASDVTERKNAELEILKCSMEDYLTGALNRKAFEESATELISQYKNSTHGMIMLDIDNFKDINDSFGHIMGDRVLFDTCSRLRTVLNDGDLLGRIGGDEFMILIKDISLNDAKGLHKRLQDIVDVARAEFNAGHFVSVSLGLSIYPNDGKTFDELYRTSDLAVYHAKKEGRDRFMVYSPSFEKNKIFK